MVIVVTGASGFVGGAVCRELLRRGVTVRAAARHRPAQADHAQWIESPDLAADADWSPVVAGAGVVVHCAARVHVMQDKSADPLAEFRRANTEGTLALARQCAAMGVSRFVFVSSIKVNGEQTAPGQPFGPDETPTPSDPYGISKWEAEQALRELSRQTGMEVVIVRPPLVYGPGVRANFLGMMRWLARGVPLPLGAMKNSRSLVALDNLVDLLCLCSSHPAAAGHTFLVSDGEDVSTTELLRKLGRALEHPARLIPVPPAVLGAMGAVVGRADIGRRLCSSLQVDISKTRAVLGWKPVVPMDSALKETARDFLSHGTQ